VFLALLGRFSDPALSFRARAFRTVLLTGFAWIFDQYRLTADLAGRAAAFIVSFEEKPSYLALFAAHISAGQSGQLILRPIRGAHYADGD
jgi:hypothetical protein